MFILQLEHACTSLTMSPTGDFLATAHVNYLGLFLWANKSLFSHISLRAINPDAEVPLLDLPTSMENASDALNDEMDLLAIETGEMLDLDYKSPVQLDDELITMSTLAAARWQNLLNIDIVKRRNKPKAPPKVPKQAPFFLPTVAGLDLKFDLTNAALDETNSSKLLIPDNFNNFTVFGKILDDTNIIDGFQKAIEHITNLGPSMIDFEIKSLHPDGGGRISIMLKFMQMIEFMLKTNLNFELAQTYLGVFLKAHSRTIVEHIELRDYLVYIEEAQARGWKVLEDKLMYGIGVVDTLRNFTT